MAGILISLLASRTKLSPGITHSALLSFITGLALVGLRYPLVEADPVKWESIDNLKISIKTLIVLTILILGFRYKRKESVSPVFWWSVASLALGNIAIAVWW
jgi:hypothetical protein